MEAIKRVEQATRHSNTHFHILAIAVSIACAAGRANLATKYKQRLLHARSDYRIADFFRAFPLRSKDHIALVRDSLRLAGLPD